MAKNAYLQRQQAIKQGFLDVGNEKAMPIHPCQGCVYYKVCGESTRTAPCYGRMTKRERMAQDGK